MRRVLLVQPSLQPPGGGNGVAGWTLQALAGRHRVTVLSWEPVDVDPINRFFGTSLRASDFDRLSVPASWRAAAARLPIPAALLRSALLMRHARRVTGAFDVILGIHNEVDYGRRGIQYIHYPTYLRPRPDVDLRWYHRSRRLLGAYYGLADRIAGFSAERMKANLTLANSNWTAARVRASLGIPARTVYPPILAPDRTTPWNERRNGFVAVGRISPEKEYERIIRILAIVRATHPGITLTIVGTCDRHTRGYYESLRRQASSLGPWIEFRQNIPRDDVRALMTTHRYGIHGMREEHFGMTPAEMALAGMIVWVPNGGGQVEIVGAEPALTYEDDDQAATTIARVLSDDAEQERLRAALSACSTRFGVPRFIDEMRSIVETFEG